MRIVSLLASTTEIVGALGRLDDLVGRSHECDFPPEVETLPALCSARLDTSAPSAIIDADVKRLVAQALSVYEVDAQALADLKPDVILTQTLCEVCAVSPRDLDEAVQICVASDARIVPTTAGDIGGIWHDIESVGAAIGAEAAARQLIADCQRRMTEVAQVAQRAATRPRIACLEWIDPLMAGGNWVPELVALAGGENLFGTAGEHSPWMTIEALVEADPDIIVVLPCGFDLDRCRAEMPALTNRPEWQRLSAVRAGQVYLTDGNQYFNRPGPRIVESLEIMAEILHPDVCDYGHRGVGWQPL